jgi:hypothetical protein
MRGCSLSAGLLAFLCAAAPAAAQQESLNAGVSGAVGFPSFAGGVRIGTPLGPKAGGDLSIVRLAGASDASLSTIAHLRWIRGGRKPSGDSRYWIGGVMFTSVTSSTTYLFPGQRITRRERHTLVVPRIGYGWDHVSANGARAGFELTTGAAGEEAGFMFANVFVTWGPPRRAPRATHSVSAPIAPQGN